MDNTNEAYRTYCAQNRLDIPIFHQDWWLDAVMGKEHWLGLVSKSKFGGKAAILPIFQKQKWGISIIRNPSLTPYQGPWWAGYWDMDHSIRFRIATKLWPELLEQIPRHSSFRQRFHPEVQEGLSFHSIGYQLGIRYTFSLDLSIELTDLKQSMRRDIRRKLRHVEDWSFKPTNDIDLLFPLIEAIYNRQNQTVPYSKVLLHRIIETTSKHKAFTLTLAVSPRGVCGGLLLLQDSKRLYVLASGLNELGRQLGAFPALIWHSIQKWHRTDLILDFCGSMLPTIADHNAAFGAKGHLVIEAKQQSKWLNLIRKPF